MSGTVGCSECLIMDCMLGEGRERWDLWLVGKGNWSKIVNGLAFNTREFISCILCYVKYLYPFEAS